jgi:glycerol-3-phosphate acyltransferase PlsY
MVLAIQPLVALCVIAVFLLVLYLTRFVSLSSILASMAFPLFIMVVFNEPEPLYRVFAIAVALMVILTHQKNISRLLQGNESKAGIFRRRDRRGEK